MFVRRTRPRVLLDVCSCRAYRSRTAAAPTDTVQIPAFTGLKDLAKATGINAKVLFKQLKGSLGSKHFWLIIDGKKYKFPSLGKVIVPFQAVEELCSRLNKKAVLKQLEPTVPKGEAGSKPVVVLLGHFNHGKTTLLDALLGHEPGRDLVSLEPHGITQEIRARTVDFGGISTTVLDTPGQDIFFRMRSGGARVADAALIVVSAVGGVKQQTHESVGCAETLGLPAVVAINKMDMVQGTRRKQAVLTGLRSELRNFRALRSSTLVPVSALKRTNLDKLRGAVASQLKEVIEWRDRFFTEGEPVAGAVPWATVVDFARDRGRGTSMLLLVHSGHLRTGDTFAAGVLWGTVRAVYDELGEKTVSQAGPGEAVRVLLSVKEGKADVPLGDPFYVISATQAAELVSMRVMQATLPKFEFKSPGQQQAEDPVTDAGAAAAQQAGALDNSDEPGSMEQEAAELPSQDPEAPLEHPGAALQHLEPEPQEQEVVLREVVVKADTAQSLAAILDNIQDEPRIRVLRSGLGNVTASEAAMAGMARCPVFTYMVQLDSTALKQAKESKTKIFRSETVQGVLENITQHVEGLQKKRHHQHLLDPLTITPRIAGAPTS